MHMLLDKLYEFKNTLVTIFPPSLSDLLDILFLAFILYKIFQFMKETRAGSLAKGVMFMGVVYLLVVVLNMRVLSWIFEKVFSLGVLALIILFQPEIRRTMERLATTGVASIVNFAIPGNEDAASDWTQCINDVAQTCWDFHSDEEKTGALFVFERETKLGEQIESGTILNADSSVALYKTIFYKGTDMHDGAVILRNGKVYAGGCFLPLPEVEAAVKKNLGSRHRAAIGMSENSDACVIVVSEENGGISFAENGKIIPDIRSKDQLVMLLSARFEQHNKKIKRDDKWTIKRNDSEDKKKEKRKGLFSSKPEKDKDKQVN